MAELWQIFSSGVISMIADTPYYKHAAEYSVYMLILSQWLQLSLKCGRQVLVVLKLSQSVGVAVWNGPQPISHVWLSVGME